ncbi:MAG: amidophosphoribosyltransferase [Methanocalculaceae archaeon]|jgi:amidophosphoribosyltransferase|nr:amidophosphoribosyltransferase [Methanocalculaceae archaeon]
MSGIAGIVDSRGVAYPLYYALHALQHRGQEAAGVSIFHAGSLATYKGPGQLSEVFGEQILPKLPGNVGIGQVLYTQKAHRGKLENIQPLKFSFQGHELSITISGALVRDNRETLRAEYEGKGHIFSTTTNAELIAVIIAHEIVSGADTEDAFVNAIQRLKGAYAGVAILDGVLYAFRDPLGTKPLCLGKVATGYIVASESVAIDTLSGQFLRDITPGELVTVTWSGVSGRRVLTADHKAYCVFEYIYTARPDSVIEGVLVYDVRRKIGERLAKHPVRADLVSPVPDSGTAFAIGFADASGIPYTEGLLKNRYVGRTFIMPTQILRKNAVQMMLNPIRCNITGRSVVLVDDSIVRGTTALRIVNMVREFGAVEVHLRIGSTPIVAPCHFGVDLPTHEELIASTSSIEKIREMIHATTLEYIAFEDMVESIGIPREDLCMACFCGDYPLEIPGERSYACRRVVTVDNG